MDNFLSDLRYAARGLLRAPGVALVAVFTLSLGIGLTTVMFSIVYGVMSRGLPFPDSERIMSLNRANPSQGLERIGVPVHDYVDWQDRQRSLEDLAAFYIGTVNVTIGERPERYTGGFMTGNSFSVLGVQPAIGRAFTPDDSRPGAPMTLLLGHTAWRDHFGSDPGVLGRTVKVNGEIATVIGVMPEGFLFPELQQVWVPLRLDPVATPRGQGQTVTVFAKLRPDVSVDAAAADLARIADAIAAEHPEVSQGITATVRPFTEDFIGPEERTTLLAMLATVGLVLLIACANVANLLLARAAVRTRDVAIRVSIGATRTRVIVQMMAEALVLALAGAVVGSGLAWVGIGLFERALPPDDLPFWFVFALDAPILAFVAAISLLAALVSGAIPALRASSTDLNAVLKDESRGTSSLHMGRLSRALVVGEVAMSVAMLVGSGLMIRSVIMLDRMQLPYPTEEVFTARVALLDNTSLDGAARQRLWDDIEQRVAALPGLGTGSLRTHVEGTTYATSEDIPRARIAVVSPGFFATYGVEAVQGRLLNALDTRDAPRVAVVNESFVRARFPDGIALGRRVRTGPLETDEEWREIVGVVPDLGLVAVSDNVPQSQQAGLYVPLAQGDERFISISAVADGAPLALTGPVRAAVTAADPDTPIYFVDTLRARIDQDLWFYGVFGGLFAVFGGAALFMASVGLYGVMSFSVSRRTQEMGIRMALGAEGGQVRALVLRQGMVQIGLGLVLGTGLAVLVARGLQYIVYQANAFDPATYAVVFAALALTGLAASAIPAARATRVHPSQALRYE